MQGFFRVVPAVLVAIMCGPVLAVDSIPETSGFSGFFLVAPGGFNVSSNLIHGGAPLLDDIANNPIESIFDPPSAHSSAAMLVAGEVNYTVSGTRTQLFFGNRLEDLLRLDAIFGTLDGQPSIILISDNNYRDLQHTAVFLLKLRPGGAG